jgi:hypothetical protein
VETRSSGLFFVLLVLLGAAVVVFVFERKGESHRKTQREAFQRLVGGLGFGPATDLAGCAFGFDPRLDGSCSEECGPIPGGACFCPRHAGSLLVYPPLERGMPLPTEDDHGPLP